MGEGGRGGRRTRRVGEGFKRFHFTSLVLISSGLWIPGMGVFFYFFSKTLDFGEFWTALCLFSSSFFFFLFCFVTDSGYPTAWTCAMYIHCTWLSTRRVRRAARIKKDNTGKSAWNMYAEAPFFFLLCDYVPDILRTGHVFPSESEYIVGGR